MISNEVFVSSFSCRRRAFLKQAGQVGEPADIERVQHQLDRCFTRTALDRFLAQHLEGEVLRQPPALEPAIQSSRRFIAVRQPSLFQQVAAHQVEDPLLGPGPAPGALALPTLPGH
jgi:hypothetical protein